MSEAHPTEGPPHPIVAVANEAAQLSHILELQIENLGFSPASLDNAFSASTSNALRRCAAFPTTETTDGRPVVDSGSYLKAVLGAGEYEHKTESEALAKAIVGSNTDRLTPIRDKIGGSDRSGPTEDELARCIASPDLTEMLAEAARLASQVSSGQVRVDWRHALVACLKRLPAQQAIWAEGLSTEISPDAVFSQIRSTLTNIGALAGKDEAGTDESDRSDDPSLWASELDAVQPHPDLRLPEPERRSDTHYVRDDPVKTLTEDRLGLASEVRALAEVICLREPGPPLAIGLFGDWGSGKSTYMNLIEAAIDELTRRTTSDQQARDLFVEGVVHIKFNAWHYNDADLWSSLTSEFFRQLRVGGHAGLDDYSALVRQVAERVATAEAAADKEGKSLESKRSSASELRKRLAELDRQDATLPTETLLATARAEVAALPEKDKQRLYGLLGHLVPPLNREREQEALLGVEAGRLLGTYGTASVTWRGLLNALSGRGGAVSRPVYLWLAGGLKHTEPRLVQRGQGSTFQAIGRRDIVPVGLLRIWSDRRETATDTTASGGDIGRSYGRPHGNEDVAAFSDLGRGAAPLLRDGANISELGLTLEEWQAEALVVIGMPWGGLSGDHLCYLPQLNPLRRDHSAASKCSVARSLSLSPSASSSSRISSSIALISSSISSGSRCSAWAWLIGR